MNDIILSTQNGQAVVSSLDIAKNFEKRHDSVMRAIEDIVEGLHKNVDTPADMQRLVTQRLNRTAPSSLLPKIRLYRPLSLINVVLLSPDGAFPFWESAPKLTITERLSPSST